MHLIAVTGLRTEARIAAGPRVHAVVGGGDGEGLARALDAAITRRRASAIISFGVSGGLTAGLAPGAAMVARGVVTADGTRYPSDPAWSKRLFNGLGADAHLVDIAGIDSPLAEHEEKHALHLATGAHAADTESHIAAKAAATYDLPFAALRVIIDPVHRRLPPAALVALKSDGSLDYGAVARSVLREPNQIPQLTRIAFDAKAAFLALLRSRKVLAGALGHADLGELLLDVPAEDVLSGTLQV